MPLLSLVLQIEDNSFSLVLGASLDDVIPAAGCFGVIGRALCSAKLTSIGCEKRNPHPSRDHLVYSAAPSSKGNGLREKAMRREVAQGRAIFKIL
jgi:hypothetical protein